MRRNGNHSLCLYNNKLYVVYTYIYLYIDVRVSGREFTQLLLVDSRAASLSLHLILENNNELIKALFKSLTSASPSQQGVSIKHQLGVSVHSNSPKSFIFHLNNANRHLILHAITMFQSAPAPAMETSIASPDDDGWRVASPFAAL